MKPRMFIRFAYVLLLLVCVDAGSTLRAQARQIKKADTAFRYHMYDVSVTQYQKAFARMGRKAKSDPDEKNRLLFQIESGQTATLSSRFLSPPGRAATLPGGFLLSDRSQPPCGYLRKSPYLPPEAFQL